MSKMENLMSEWAGSKKREAMPKQRVLIRPGETVAYKTVQAHNVRQRDFWLQEYVEGGNQEYEVPRTFGVPISLLAASGYSTGLLRIPPQTIRRVKVDWIAGYEPPHTLVEYHLPANDDRDAVYVKGMTSDGRVADGIRITAENGGRPVYLIESVKIFGLRAVPPRLSEEKYLATTELRIWDGMARGHHGIEVENVTDKRLEVTLQI